MNIISIMMVLIDAWMSGSREIDWNLLISLLKMKQRKKNKKNN